MINASSDRNYLRFQRGVYCGQGNFHNWNVCKYMKWKCTLAVAHFLWSIASVGEKPENDGALIWSTCFLREPPLVATAFIGCLKFIVGRCYNAVASLASSIAVWAQQWLCCSRYASVSLGLVLKDLKCCVDYQTFCWRFEMPEAFGGFRIKWRANPVPVGIWIGGRPCAPLRLGLEDRWGFYGWSASMWSWFAMSTVSPILYVVLMVYLIRWWHVQLYAIIVCINSYSSLVVAKERGFLCGTLQRYFWKRRCCCSFQRSRSSWEAKGQTDDSDSFAVCCQRIHKYVYIYIYIVYYIVI